MKTKLALTILLMTAQTWASQVPEHLNFTRPEAGPRLTKSQVEEIRKTFSSRPMMVLPPGELVFPAKDSTPADQRKSEQELARRDANSYAMLKDIQSNCMKGHPTLRLDATFPTDGDLQLENLKVNDHFWGDYRTSLSGDQCPVNVALGSAAAGRVDSVDARTKSIAGSGSYSTKGQLLIKNPRYARLLKSRGIIVDSSISGLAAMKDTQNRAFVTFKLAGTYLSLSQNIPYDMNVQVVSQTNAKQKTFSEVVMSTEIKLSGFTAHIVSHSSGWSDSKKQKSELYINGHLTSEKEFGELFGEQNPAGFAQKNGVVQTLK